jgi:hypothetical protein
MTKKYADKRHSIYSIIINILIVLFSVVVTTEASGQKIQHFDSVEVRVLNKGKHYIKEHIITLGKVDYKFSDIRRNHYSEYQKLPYLWSNNLAKTTIIAKKMFKYDQWLTSLLWPIDHVGEEKYLTGKMTIELRTKVKSGQLKVEQVVVKE